MTEHQILKTKVVIYEHRDRLVKYLTRFITSLVERAATHDDSKFQNEELGPYSEVIGEFKNHKFGSPGYEEIRKRLDSALLHHYTNNRHHPEHFETGVNEMDLIDILEMLADWKAASLNAGGNGDIVQSILLMSEKHGINPQLTQIIINTAKNYGLV